MEQFYVIVITIAIVLLILALTYIGVFLIGDDTAKVTFPPHSNQCPDYWEVNGDGACIIPTNGINLGTAGSSVDFVKKKDDGITADDTYPFQPTDTTNPENIDFQDKTICEKKQWSNDFGVVWDGVTNYNKC